MAKAYTWAAGQAECDGRAGKVGKAQEVEAASPEISPFMQRALGRATRGILYAELGGMFETL